MTQFSPEQQGVLTNKTFLSWASTSFRHPLGRCMADFQILLLWRLTNHSLYNVVQDVAQVQVRAETQWSMKCTVPLKNKNSLFQTLLVSSSTQSAQRGDWRAGRALVGALSIGRVHPFKEQGALLENVSSSWTSWLVPCDFAIPYQHSIRSVFC